MKNQYALSCVFLFDCIYDMINLIQIKFIVVILDRLEKLAQPYPS